MKYTAISKDLPSLLKGRGRNNTRLSATAMEKKTRIRVTDDQDEEKEISEAIEGMMELCKIGESEYHYSG